MALIIQGNDYFVDCDKHDEPWGDRWINYCQAWQSMRSVPAPCTASADALGCKCEGVSSHEEMKDCSLHTFEDSERILRFMAGDYDEAA